MTGAVFVYVTHPDAAEAARLGRSLVEAGLAACVNIIPRMRTIYRWNGAVEDGDETVMIVKTVVSSFDAVAAHVRAVHPYECPCIVAIPLSAGAPAYLAWIADSVASSAGG